MGLRRLYYGDCCSVRRDTEFFAVWVTGPWSYLLIYSSLPRHQFQYFQGHDWKRADRSDEIWNKAGVDDGICMTVSVLSFSLIHAARIQHVLCTVRYVPRKRRLHRGVDSLTNTESILSTASIPNMNSFSFHQIMIHKETPSLFGMLTLVYYSLVPTAEYIVCTPDLHTPTCSSPVFLEPQSYYPARHYFHLG